LDGSNSARALVREINTARTWLSLTGFSVTLKTLHTLRRASTVQTGATSHDALTLLAIGIVLVGTANQLSFLLELRRQHAAVKHDGVSQGRRSVSLSLLLVVSLVLLMIGIVAISSMACAMGRLG
jgi:hypothetical protein